MINAFKIKKISFTVLAPMLGAMFFMIGSIFYGLLGGIGFAMCACLISWLLSVVFLNNPFTALIEGKGILTLAIDSTGVVRPFIVGLNPPHIQGSLLGRKIKGLYDRNSALQLATPKTVKKGATLREDGGVDIKISEKQFNQSRFAMFHYPVLIYNMMLDSFMTKDYLGEVEKDTLANHLVLELNKHVDELSDKVRDFARHMAEQLRPGESIFKKPWVWIVIVVFLVILGAMFIKPIIAAVSAAGGAATASGGIVG